MRITADFEGITAAVIELEQGARITRPLKIFANTQLAKYCDKYVPASHNRIMSGNVNITPEYVQYPGPYAHYQWEGVVYAPSIPITENGEVVGFFSPKNRPKTKTDRKLKYSREIHPLAQAHWDRAAMARHKGDLENDIRRYIVDRYGGKNNG